MAGGAALSRLTGLFRESKLSNLPNSGLKKPLTTYTFSCSNSLDNYKIK